MADRARGAVLYACALAFLAAGGTWWVRAAPPSETDPQLGEWKRTAHRLLPDDGAQRVAGDVALRADAEHEVVSPVGVGEYTVSVVCVGAAGSRVQLRFEEGSREGNSGVTLGCAGEQPDSYPVNVGTQLQMHVSVGSVGSVGPVIFRYAVLRVP